VKIILHSWSRHGNADAIKIRYPKEKNEQAYDAMPSLRGVAHRALSHGFRARQAAFGEVALDSDRPNLAGKRRMRFPIAAGHRNVP